MYIIYKSSSTWASAFDNLSLEVRVREFMFQNGLLAVSTK